MNLKLKVTCTLLLFCLFLQAQDRTSFGIKGALNLAEFQGLDMEDGYENTKRISYAAGIYLNQQLSNDSNLQLGVLYSEKGSDLDSNNSPGLLYQLNYVSTPLTYRYHIGSGGSFHLLVGVQPSFLINNKLKITEDDNSVTVDLDTYYADGGADIQVNTFDFAVSGGIGIGLPYSAMLSASYSYGLLDVFKGSDAPKGVRNTVIEVGFCFSLFN